MPVDGRHVLAVCLMTLALGAARAAPAGAPEAPLDRLERDAARVSRDARGRPVFFEFGETSAATRDDFFAAYADSLGLGPEDEMHLEREVVAEGVTRALYRQHHRGVPLEYGLFALSTRDGRLSEGLGDLVRGLDLDPRPSLDEDGARAALDLAWRLQGNARNGLRTEARQRGQLVFATRGDLQEPSGYFLAWRFDLRPTPSGPFWTALVDARDGTVRALAARVSDFNATALYLTPSTVNVNGTIVGSQWLLQQTSPNWSIVTRDLRGYLVALDDHTFVPAPPVGTAGSSALVTAHWAADALFRYLELFHNRKALHGLGAAGPPLTLYGLLCSPLSSCPNDAARASNAGWISGTESLELGAGVGLFARPLSDPDVVFHELGHGLAEHALNGGFAHWGEPGAIAEGLSDALAYAAKNSWPAMNNLLPTQKGPQIGINAFPPSGKRDIGNPTPRGLPDRYKGAQWKPIVPPCDASNDNCEVHDNSTVASHWFYHLVHGMQPDKPNSAGQKYESMALDFHSAYKIVYGALTGLNCNGCTPVLPNGSLSTFAAATTAVAQKLSGADDAETYYSVARAWESANLGNGPVDPAPYKAALVPAAGATNVDPWPTSVSFATRNYESAWEAQFDTVNTFDSPDRRTQQVSGAGGTTVSSGISLKSDKTYYWRVRATSPYVGNWRGTYTFTTKKKAPSLSKPANGATPPAWIVTLEWATVAGAQSYDYELAQAADFADATQKNTAGTSGDVDVEIGGFYYWRVRSRSADAGDFSEWSPVRTFVAQVPKVEALGPANNALAYPWPVAFQWKAVRGATAYYLETATTAPNPQFVPELSTLVAPAGNGTQNAGRAFAADGSITSVWWRVAVVGGKKTPPDAGLPSDLRVALLDTAKTAVSYVAPYPAPGYFEHGDALTPSWNAVKGATSYQLTVRAMDVNGTATASVATVTVPATAPTVTSSVPGSGEPVYGVYGYRYHVQAFGPANLPGTFSADKAYAVVRPDAPKLGQPTFAPADPQSSYVSGSINWSSEFAPQGYYLWAHEGADCQGPLVAGGIQELPTPQNVSLHQKSLDGLSLARNTQYSAIVNVEYPSSGVFQGVPQALSSCVPFVTPDLDLPDVSQPFVVFPNEDDDSFGLALEFCGQPFQDPYHGFTGDSVVIFTDKSEADQFEVLVLAWGNGQTWQNYVVSAADTLVRTELDGTRHHVLMLAVNNPDRRLTVDLRGLRSSTNAVGPWASAGGGPWQAPASFWMLRPSNWAPCPAEAPVPWP